MALEYDDSFDKLLSNILAESSDTQCELVDQLQATLELPTKEFTSKVEPYGLKLSEQPQEKFNFRFKSQATNVELLGCSKRSYPTAVLYQLRYDGCPVNSGAYFIRCSLHQVQSAEEETSSVSPHFLCRLNETLLTPIESHLFPCTVSQNVYSFKLDKAVIVKTAREDWLNVLINKLKSKLKQDLQMDSNAELSQEQKLQIEIAANKQVKKPQDKVRLCFDAFELTASGSYVKIAGPTFSDCIINGEPPYIKRICNLDGSINEKTDVTLLTKHAKPAKNHSVLIFEKNNVGSDAPCIARIKLNDSMIHMGAAITFQMPIYNGEHLNAAQVICCIQLERFSDGARSNIVEFTYTKCLKRQRLNENNEGNCFKNKRPVAKATISANIHNMHSDSIIITEGCCTTPKMQHPILPVRKVSDDKKWHATQYFKSYLPENLHRNSILHDILKDDMKQKYVTEMSCTVQHFELCDMHLTQTHVDCLDIVIEAMRNNTNFDSYLLPLQSYNILGLTPLHLAVINNNVPLIVEILKCCKRYNSHTCERLSEYTILHMAALRCTDQVKSTTVYDCILKYSSESALLLQNYAGNTAAGITKLDEIDLLADTTQKMNLQDI